MDREVKKKDELIKEFIEQIKDFTDIYNVGGADYEQASVLARELADLCELDTEYVVVEECQMAESGIMIKPCEIKVKK